MVMAASCWAEALLQQGQGVLIYINIWYQDLIPNVFFQIQALKKAGICKYGKASFTSSVQVSQFL